MIFKYIWKEKIGPILYLQLKNKKYGICFCHKIKERSIKFLGLEKIFCSRCLGIFLGGIVALILHLFQLHISLLLFMIMILPLSLDGSTQYLGFRKSNNILRLFTGILFGISINYIGVLI